MTTRLGEKESLLIKATTNGRGEPAYPTAFPAPSLLRKTRTWNKKTSSPPRWLSLWLMSENQSLRRSLMTLPMFPLATFHCVVCLQDMLNELPHENLFIAYAKLKVKISCSVTMLISAFDSTNPLHSKSQIPSTVCIGSGQKPQSWFSSDMAEINL